MADEHIYRNTPTNVVSKEWGVAVWSAAAAAYVSSQQCKECWIITAPGNSVFVNFDATATATNGIPISASTVHRQSLGPLPISNLSVINIFPKSACTAWIIWRK